MRSENRHLNLSRGQAVDGEAITYLTQSDPVREQAKRLLHLSSDGARTMLDLRITP